MTNTYTKVLTIAGTDPSGGAGIQADLKTFAALGCYGLSVITALVAQNTQGVRGIQAITDSFIHLQLSNLYADIFVDTIKIGMLHNARVIQTVAEFFKEKTCTLIVDPVMTAKDGSLLLETEAVIALREQLLPMATVITPNLPEAELLLQWVIRDRHEMELAAKALAAKGPQAVLVKGGHLTSADSSDCLYIKATQECIWLESTRINTRNTHGTGCTLSAAIAALLAKGLPLKEAVTEAKVYLTAALQAGAEYPLGQGHGPVHHFYQLWETS